MAEHQTFTGFFSYANHDAKTDPGLITAFTRQLEYSINAKLANARFQIWRDKDGLRTGERWSDTINDELRRAAVLIVLLTPRWIESEYCRKEFAVFEEVEASRRVGDYVAPILARPIEQQKKHLTPGQLDVLARIADRQYFKAIANDFLTLTEAQRNAEIDKVADDIAGMIDRLRSLARMPARSVIARRYTGRRGLREFSTRAEDYAEVDFLRSSEVRVDRAQNHGERCVYAQIDFVERLYVKSTKAYIEFGITHAILSVAAAGQGQVRKLDGFNVQDVDRAAYVSLQEFPEAVSVAMYASPGRGLAELALPPTNDNYWSRIATATADVRADRLRAELRVSFSPHGLHIAEGRSQPLSQATKRKIEAIIGVAIEKNERVGPGGRICRSVPIGERIP